MEVLVFHIDAQRYGVHLAALREVVAAVRITALPAAPAVVEGVIDVRGRLAAVFDLRRRFQLPPRPLHSTERLVIATAGARLVAFRCDHVEGLVALDPAHLEDPREAVPGAKQVCGVARLEDGLLLIHDLEAFLSEAETEALEGALETQHRGDGE
ncbi:MAG: chemotaxis protein CheW [Pseudomonadota bacterium]